MTNKEQRSGSKAGMTGFVVFYISAQDSTYNLILGFES